MKLSWIKVALIMLGSIAIPSAQAAVDSYRYTHVTISTPWYIFIFLLMGIFAPFVLIAILAWRGAMRKPGAANAEKSEN